MIRAQGGPPLEKEGVVHIRVTWTDVEPQQLEEAIATFEPRVVAPTRSEPGFLGAVLLANKQEGTGATVTHWESEQALRASEERAESTRAQATRGTGLRVRDVERYEVVLQVRKGAPRVGTAIRVNNIRGRRTGFKMASPSSANASSHC